MNICNTAHVIDAVDKKIMLTGADYNGNSKILDERLTHWIHLLEQKKGPQKYALVLDHVSLDDMFTSYMEEFVKLIRCVDVVICCRVTPLQKALVTEIVQKRLKKRGLAIGDGANDVSMIQKAYVGVGVMGNEGNQACRASDYALPKFRYLRELLAVEGRYCYLRSSECVFLSFYKNLFYVTTQFVYLGFNGWSAQLLGNWRFFFCSYFFFFFFFQSILGFISCIIRYFISCRHS